MKDFVRYGGGEEGERNQVRRAEEGEAGGGGETLLDLSHFFSGGNTSKEEVGRLSTYTRSQIKKKIQRVSPSSNFPSSRSGPWPLNRLLTSPEPLRITNSIAPLFLVPGCSTPAYFTPVPSLIINSTAFDILQERPCTPGRIPEKERSLSDPPPPLLPESSPFSFSSSHQLRRESRLHKNHHQKFVPVPRLHPRLGREVGVLGEVDEGVGRQRYQNKSPPATSRKVFEFIFFVHLHLN
jgi:hypothetical protein